MISCSSCFVYGGSSTLPLCGPHDVTVPVMVQNPPPVKERGGGLLPLSTTVVKKGVKGATEIGCSDTVDGQT